MINRSLWNLLKTFQSQQATCSELVELFLTRHRAYALVDSCKRREMWPDAFSSKDHLILKIEMSFQRGS